MWPLPVVAMLGTAGCAMFSFTSGVFITEITGEFGWTRAQFSTAFVLQMVFGLGLAPLVGRLVDKFGARRIALFGIVPFMVSFGMLGLATQSVWVWWALCLFLALCQALIIPTVWITP